MALSYESNWTLAGVSLGIFISLQFVLQCYADMLDFKRAAYRLLFGALLTSSLAIVNCVAWARCRPEYAIAFWTTWMTMIVAITGYSFFEKELFNYGKACIVMLVSVIISTTFFLILYRFDSSWETLSLYLVMAFFGWFIVHEMDLFLTKKKNEFNVNSAIVASSIIYSDMFLFFIAIFTLFSSSSEESK